MDITQIAVFIAALGGLAAFGGLCFSIYTNLTSKNRNKGKEKEKLDNIEEQVFNHIPTQMKELKTELKEDINKLETNLKEDIKEVKEDIKEVKGDIKELLKK